MPTFDTDTLSKAESYKLLTGAIVPRPIAWVSTLSNAGVPNLAPFSFFNGVAAVPATLGFTVGVDAEDGSFKDTHLNLRENGQCVVNIVTEATATVMNQTSINLPFEDSEWEYAGLTPQPSDRVKPARVLGSPIQFECELSQMVTLQNELGRSDLMLCHILLMHVDDRVYLGDHKIDQVKMQAVGRMGGTDYTRTQDLFNMPRQHFVTDNVSKD